MISEEFCLENTPVMRASLSLKRLTVGRNAWKDTISQEHVPIFSLEEGRDVLIIPKVMPWRNLLL